MPPTGWSEFRSCEGLRAPDVDTSVLPIFGELEGAVPDRIRLSRPPQLSPDAGAYRRDRHDRRGPSFAAAYGLRSGRHADAAPLGSGAPKAGFDARLRSACESTPRATARRCCARCTRSRSFYVIKAKITPDMYGKMVGQRTGDHRRRRGEAPDSPGSPSSTSLAPRGAIRA